jgi:site-specific recombinase XerD
MVSLMQDQKYGARSIYRAVQTAGRFLAWLESQVSGIDDLDYADIERFIAHRVTTGELRYGERAALMRLRVALLHAGVIAPPAPADDRREHLLKQFEANLRRRGYREKSIASYLWFCRPFVQEQCDGTMGFARLTSAMLLGYIERHVCDRSKATAAIMCSRLRIFLRFLHAEGHVSEDFAAAVPSARSTRLATLPSHMPAAQVEAVLANCDRTTVAGRRDYAVLLLLARLGLRAGEVAALTLDDIDWRAGVLRVDGKGGRHAIMPMPQDAGAAIADYVRNGRPQSGSRVIFHRVETPCTPFATATPVILLAGRALRRAGVEGVARRYSHVFRHSLATGMIRAGASLNEIGQVLRHQSPDTTRIYAKVDIAALRRLSLAWPGGAQ